MNKFVIKQNGNNILVKVISSIELGGRKCNTISFELWTDIEKYVFDIPEEFIDGHQYIYRSRYATTNEQSAINMFNSRFVEKV